MALLSIYRTMRRNTQVTLEVDDTPSVQHFAKWELYLKCLIEILKRIRTSMSSQTFISCRIVEKFKWLPVPSCPWLLGTPWRPHWSLPPLESRHCSRTLLWWRLSSCTWSTDRSLQSTSPSQNHHTCKTNYMTFYIHEVKKLILQDLVRILQDVTSCCKNLAISCKINFCFRLGQFLNTSTWKVWVLYVHF